MTLREKILKTFIVTIREVNTHGGPQKFFEKYPVGGMYYSESTPYLDENGKEIGISTTFEGLNECKKYSKNKLLVCADGAHVRGQKIKFWPQTSLGSSANLDDAYHLGKVTGMQMNDKGIDWVLQPSIDMCFDKMMYLTAINDDPQIIAKIYRQVVRGIQDQGVCATVKHFPGLGTNFVNMHIGAGANTLPFDEWLDTYGYTYKEMFKEDVMCVMTSHVTLRSYDNDDTDGYCPIATYSKKLTMDLLKGKLGFQGAVVTDALIMGGMATGDLVAETVQAFKCGADLLLWPPVEAAEKIEELILSGEIPMSRLEDALARIQRMENFRNKALEKKFFDEPDSSFVDEKLLQIAEHGICQLRNTIGLLPIDREKYRKILIVDAAEKSSRSAEFLKQELMNRGFEAVAEGGSKSAELLKQELIDRGFEAEIRCDIYDPYSWVSWQSDIDKLQEEFDLMIFHLNAHFVSHFGVPHMLIWASHLFDKSRKIIVNYGSPYFAVDYLPDDPTYIEMNCVASKETVKMLVDRLLGEAEFTGKSIIKKFREDVT